MKYIYISLILAFITGCNSGGYSEGCYDDICKKRHQDFVAKYKNDERTFCHKTGVIMRESSRSHLRYTSNYIIRDGESGDVVKCLYNGERK